MSMTISSRQFNQEVSRAKKTALNGPVFITDRGRPSHVLLSIKKYQEITKQNCIAEKLAMPKAAVIRLKIPRLKNLYQPEDFS